MDVEALVAAGDRALELRGTAMYALRGDADRWCAICAAVDGSVELRVGEPRRGWLRRRPAAGEGWLEDHGFTHVLDAWAAPAPAGASTRVYAQTLASALVEALGAPSDGELVEVLFHPGVLDGATPPAPGAPHAEHIAYALATLAARGSGKADIQGGRPAATWAWLFVVDAGTLNVSPEPVEIEEGYERDWDVPLDELDAAAEAEKLAALLHGDPGRDERDPLFLTFMDG